MLQTMQTATPGGVGRQDGSHMYLPQELPKVVLYVQQGADVRRRDCGWATHRYSRSRTGILFRCHAKERGLCCNPLWSPLGGLTLQPTEVTALGVRFGKMHFGFGAKPALQFSVENFNGGWYD